MMILSVIFHAALSVRLDLASPAAMPRRVPRVWLKNIAAASGPSAFAKATADRQDDGARVIFIEV